jgi:alanyl-tRNA synthetase
VPPRDVPAAAEGLVLRCRDLKRALATAGAPPAAVPPPPDRGTEPLPPDPEIRQAVADTARRLSVAPLDIAHRLAALRQESEQLAARLTERATAGPLSADALLREAVQVGGATVVVAEVPDIEPNLMRQLIDQIRQKAPHAAVLLATRRDDKVTLVAGVSPSLQQRGVSAGKWIEPVAREVGGGGGGRADLAQAGGKLPAKLPDALRTAREAIAGLLGAS